MSDRQFHNPVLPGFYPDPSICRVGDTFFLANSTFEYFPGIPIHQSKDLVNWELAGHAIHREGQLDLSKAHAFGGLWAPTIRWHKGLFYVLCTNTGAEGNFIVTSKAVAGPWSDPIFYEKEGFDPSIEFDGDRVWITQHLGGETGHIIQAEYDLAEKKLKHPWKKAWDGTMDVWTEGPHLFKKDGWYYLMVAEGGTSYGHRISVARARQAQGPFEASPHNPLICHESRPDHPIQATGHGDLFQAADDSWWLIYLGIRPQGGQFHHLGRETFLAAVEWSTDGWPRLADGAQGGELSLAAPDWMKLPQPGFEFEDDFKSAPLSGHWNFLRNPDLSRFAPGPQGLALRGGPETLDQVASPSWMGLRQRHFDCVFETRMDFEPQQQDEAGINVRMNEEFQAGLALVHRDGGRKMRAWLRLEGKTVEETYFDAPEGPLDFSIRAQALSISLLCAGETRLRFEPQSMATEKAGGFTGLYFALYVSSPQENSASFAFARYHQS